MNCNKKNIKKLKEFLADGLWHTAKDIQTNTGLTPVEVRQVAGHEHDILGGNDGYKLAKFATKDELRHCVNSLRSRARKIATRANDLEGILYARR